MKNGVTVVQEMVGPAVRKGTVVDEKRLGTFGNMAVTHRQTYEAIWVPGGERNVAFTQYLGGETEQAGVGVVPILTSWSALQQLANAAFSDEQNTKGMMLENEPCCFVSLQAVPENASIIASVTWVIEAQVDQGSTIGALISEARFSATFNIDWAKVKNLRVGGLLGEPMREFLNTPTGRFVLDCWRRNRRPSLQVPQSTLIGAASPFPALGQPVGSSYVGNTGY
jgi:hypothetical protein